MLSLRRRAWKSAIRAGLSAIWVLLTLCVASCSHHRAVLQVYGGNEQTDAALAEFAAEQGLALERPEVAPVRTDEPVVMYGRGWVANEIAREVEQLLRQMGVHVSLVEAHLRNHVVTRSHIAVFLDTTAGDLGGAHMETVSEVHQLLCAQEQGEALVLLFDNFQMEIQTYIWEGEAVTGTNHYGTWSTSDGTVSLLPSDGGALEYHATTSCLTAPPNGSACRGSLRWLRGNSVPMLARCDLKALIMAMKDLGTP